LVTTVVKVITLVGLAVAEAVELVAVEVVL
jgi:hypothetical protein